MAGDQHHLILDNYYLYTTQRMYSPAAIFISLTYSMKFQVARHQKNLTQSQNDLVLVCRKGISYLIFLKFNLAFKDTRILVYLLVRDALSTTHSYSGEISF